MAKKTKPAPKPAPRFTRKALLDATYPAADAAGRAVADAANEIKLAVQDAANEIRAAIENYAARRISLDDLAAITESWAQAGKSAATRETAKAAEGVISTLKSAAAAAIRALIGA